MKSHRFVLLSLCASVFAGCSWAQSVSLADALASARYSFQVNSSGFTGAGAAILMQALDEAQFVAIGEDHQTQEIPRFTAAVCSEMAPHGLNALALETSPLAARFVENTIGKDDRSDQMKALQRRFPESIAFLSVLEENNLVEQCAEAARASNFHLWGLDQEFIGSAGWIIQSMIETSPGPQALAALKVMQKDEEQASTEAAQTGSMAKLYLLTATEKQIGAAQSAIEADGKPLTRELMAQLVESRSIYVHHVKDFRGANGRRATLLKKNFLKDYESAKAGSTPPLRVLIKAGDTHLYRGFNELHELNLGNFTSELADVAGMHALHILVLGAGGTHAAYSKYAQPFARSTFVMSEADGYKWLAPAIARRTEVSPDGPWTLYDLRRLRFGGVTNPDSDWSRVMYGYDLLVLVPNITPAQPLQ
jgi:hypothetical protein